MKIHKEFWYFFLSVFDHTNNLCVSADMTENSIPDWEETVKKLFRMCHKKLCVHATPRMEMYHILFVTKRVVNLFK